MNFHSNGTLYKKWAEEELWLEWKPIFETGFTESDVETECGALLVQGIVAWVLPLIHLAIYFNSYGSPKTYGSTWLVYVSQATNFPLAFSWLLNLMDDTLWTRRVMKKAIWIQVAGPFFGNWAGIAYHMTY